MDQSDKLIIELDERLNDIYNQSYKKALDSQNKVLNKLSEFEKLPDSDYKTAKINAQLNEIKRLESQKKNIAKVIAEAGLEASEEVKKTLAKVYLTNYEDVVDLVNSSYPDISFEIYDLKQIGIILEDSQSPFSKLAYKNMGNVTPIVRRLGNELAQAVILGESSKKIADRIQKVTGQSKSQAKRVARTERTRVQSQARFDSMGQAHNQGVEIQKEWSTRMVNSRETHIALNDKIVHFDEPFITTAGNKLMYPGDPSAPASEVINCYCVLIPILPDSEVEDITEEFLKESKPGVGKVSYDKKYNLNKNSEEVKVANWIVDNFGGNVDLLTETYTDKSPDFLWNNKLWELKKINKIKSIDTRLRKAKKQIENNPGGIIIDIQGNDLFISAIEHRVAKRMNSDVKVVIKNGDTLVKVIKK